MLELDTAPASMVLVFVPAFELVYVPAVVPTAAVPVAPPVLVLVLVLVLLFIYVLAGPVPALITVEIGMARVVVVPSSTIPPPVKLATVGIDKV